jgi:hypothetical protein
MERITEAPFWDQLTALCASGAPVPALAMPILGDRIPKSLQSICLHGHIGASMQELLEGLATRKLRCLHLEVAEDGVAILQSVLPASGWELRELSLRVRGDAADLLRTILHSPRVQHLQRLELARIAAWNAPTAEALVSSPNLANLVHLDLQTARLESAGVTTLAAASPWRRLRRLAVDGDMDGGAGLDGLVASPLLRGVVDLTLQTHRMQVTHGLARAVTHLPHLASLHLAAPYWEEGARQMLSERNSIVWTTLMGDEADEQTYRARRSPERLPPVDDAMEAFRRSVKA